MSGSTNGVPIILHHTDDATHVPDPLYAGETAWCVAPTVTRVWVGEGPPTNVNRLLLSTLSSDNPLISTSGGIPEPTTAGNWLRSNVGTWVAGLPLAGGTMTTVTTAGPTGIALTLTSGQLGAIRVTNNNSDPYSGGLYITNNAGAQQGIRVVNNGNNAMQIDNNATGQGVNVNQMSSNPAIKVNLNSATATPGIRVERTASGNNASAAFEVYSGVANVFRILAGGETTIGAPTGPAVTGPGNVNIAGGYYVNGVPIGAGIAEPTTAGNYLRSNTGTWVAGLPLTGGTLDTITGVAGGGVGLTLTNASNWAVPAAIDVTNTDSDYGIRVQNNSSYGAGLYVNVANVAGAEGIYVNGAGVGSAAGIRIDHRATQDVGIQVNAYAGSLGAIKVSSPNNVLLVGPLVLISSTGANSLNNTSLSIQHFNADIFTVRANGIVNVGTPTGPAVTAAPGNVNVAGAYYVNGQPLVFGAADSAGAGFRTVSIAN